MMDPRAGQEGCAEPRLHQGLYQFKLFCLVTEETETGEEKDGFGLETDTGGYK
jgi:hypothetical protein